jgi:hypothetical protein
VSALPLRTGTRALLVVAAAAMLTASLAACAKKGPPQPPAGVPDTYPRVYPPPEPSDHTEPQDQTQ